MTALVKIGCLLCVAALSNSAVAKVILLDELPKLQSAPTAATHQLLSLAETATTETTTDCPEFYEVVDEIGEIVTLTVDIITGTVDTVYNAANSADLCTSLTGFRCFLSQFHTIYDTFIVVVKGIASYNTNVSSTVASVKTYFDQQCWEN